MEMRHEMLLGWINLHFPLMYIWRWTFYILLCTFDYSSYKLSIKCTNFYLDMYLIHRWNFYTVPVVTSIFIEYEYLSIWLLSWSWQNSMLNEEQAIFDNILVLIHWPQSYISLKLFIFTESSKNWCPRILMKP